jgi:hypothetical protein
MARLKAAMSSPAAGPRANMARNALPVPAKPAAKPKAYKRGEKKALAGAVAFIGSLVIVGLIYAYSGMLRGPPAPPVTEAALPPAPARIARIILPGTGSQCREILFDNDTGYFSLERAVSCDSSSSAASKSFGGGSGNGGFSSFKEAFGRKL